MIVRRAAGFARSAVARGVDRLIGRRDVSKPLANWPRGRLARCNHARAQVNAERKRAPEGKRQDRHRRVGSHYLLDRRRSRRHKMLRTELSGDHDLVARLVLEGWMLRRLDHANVVRVLDLVAEFERLGIVMEYVGGGDLRRAVRFPCLLDVVGPLGAQIVCRWRCRDPGSKTVSAPARPEDHPGMIDVLIDG